MLMTLGQWNAYCAAGKNKEERKRRLMEAPVELRPQIFSHLRTVWELKERSKK